MGNNGTHASERVHILQLRAKNVKTLKEVEIDQVGEILEIRGDTGQGKTSILEAIEGGLRGLDPDMVRRGEGAAEIMLNLDVANIRRIQPANGEREVITVTDPQSGKPIQKAKEFLRAICGPSAFRPLEFVRLGAGDQKGKTDRLRQQRQMLLESMPVTLSPAQVAAAVRTLGEEVIKELASVNLDGVAYEGQHALTVCHELHAACYAHRRLVNKELEDASARLQNAPAPERPAPKEDLEACGQLERKALEAYHGAKAQANARQATITRRDNLKAQIAQGETSIPTAAQIEQATAEFAKTAEAIQGRVSEIERQIAELQEELKAKNAALSALHVRMNNVEQARNQRQAHEARKVELAEIERSLGNDLGDNLTALEMAVQAAQAATRARELQDRHDEAAGKARIAQERSERFDRLVAMFRDELPREIVQRMKMPVEGLGIEGEVVTFGGIPLHLLGTSEQIRIAVQLAAAMNPRTGFILIDGAESLGSKDRLALAQAAKALDLQLIMTYVDPLAKPGDGAVVMQDGLAVGA